MNKNILHIPSLTYFSNDWDLLQNFLKHRGNPPFHIDGNLNLSFEEIKDLGNLESVGGNLSLWSTPVKDLGNLKSVGGDLDLRYGEVESIGNLTLVGGDLHLRNTPLSNKITKNDIRSQVNVTGNIYL